MHLENSREIRLFFLLDKHQTDGLPEIGRSFFISSLLMGFIGRNMGKRADQNGVHRLQFDRNKKRILATQEICGICGKPVDKSLKYPHPMSPVIDHIIPIAKGGHPSDLDNLQLAHWCCNRQKSDKIIERTAQQEDIVISNRNLPQSMNWAEYRAKK